MRVNAKSALIASVVSLSVACGGGGGPEANRPGTTPAGGTANVSTDKNAYPAFPNPDAGADASVSAEQGGRGFTGEGWETNTDYDLIGDPRARKGGRFREAYGDFPNTLRYRGPDVTEFGYMVHNLVYESLLNLHPTSLDWMPGLATHWQISSDRMTYRYRINPNARWSDGQPVVADDVVATWMLMMDKGLQDPSAQLVFEKYDKPVAETKYIVRVTSKVLNWRNFLYFSGMPLYPAHVLKDIDGARYLKEYNYKMLPATGPYFVNESDIDRGNRITIRRRQDYWAANERRNVGTGNFDEIEQIVVRDDNLAFEMFKRGDLDYHYVFVPRQWVQEMSFDRVQRGLAQKRKVFNDSPKGTAGIAINTRKEPWNDIRVRRAFAHLLNRELLIEKILFNESIAKNSHFFGNYANPTNPKNPYDPKTAMSLLAEAGWKDRDAQGRLVRTGRPLAVELLYYREDHEPAFTIYQEDLRKVGITLNLRRVTFETAVRLVDDRQFDLAYLGYGGLLFPNPETQWHSSLADQKATNNVTGLKSPRIDALLKQYDVEFDQAKREAIIREIDGIAANEHHWILGWEGTPPYRLTYSYKFAHPDSYLTRYGDNRDPMTLWWVDEEKERQLAQAARDNSMKFPVGQTEIHYWENLPKNQTMPTATATR
jgi:microcin C transport system substrate-binding protein